MNRDEVIQNIKNNHNARHLVFEINSEGPSLHALGITDTIGYNISQIGIAPDRVWIDRWHNTVEQIPFRRAYKPRLSHFFWMSDHYRHTPRTPVTHVYPLAFFVGRLTFERAAMLWHVVHRWPTQCLLSLMQQSSPLNFSPSDVAEPWIDCNQKQEFMNWIMSPPIESITGHSVKDQYLPGNNTNRDLVAHYDGFCLELVAETYCLGDAFFPTEKTVRPISQGKPLLVYGPRHFLARLRGLGFRTWGDVWDESYDDLAEHERWQAIKVVIDNVIAIKAYQDPRIQAISQHNISVLNHIIKTYAPQ